MTDRLNGVFVVFEQDIREDDAEALINAIKMLRGVLSVKGNVSTLDDVVAQERVKRDLSLKLLQTLGYISQEKP